MTVRELLGLAPRTQKLPVGLFNTPPGNPAAQMLTGILPGGLGQPPVFDARQMLAAYSQFPWMRAIVGKLASSMAAVEWKLYAKTGGDGKAKAIPGVFRSADYAGRRKALNELNRSRELREIAQHPFYDLLATGNEYHT